MKRFVILSATLLVLAVGSARAQSTGVGLQLGNPTGLSVKQNFDEYHAAQLIVAPFQFSFAGAGAKGIGLSGRYLYHFYDRNSWTPLVMGMTGFNRTTTSGAFEVTSSSLSVGGGGGIEWKNQDENLGVQFTAGIGIISSSGFVQTLGFGLTDLSIGVHYYFEN